MRIVTSEPLLSLRRRSRIGQGRPLMCPGGVTPSRARTVGARSKMWASLPSEPAAMPGPATTAKPGPACVPGRPSGDTPETVPMRGDARAVMGASRDQWTTRSGSQSRRWPLNASSARITRLTAGAPVAGLISSRSAASSSLISRSYSSPGSTMPRGSRPLRFMRMQPSRSVIRQNAFVRDQSIAAVSTRLARLSRRPVGIMRARRFRKSLGSRSRTIFTGSSLALARG